MNFEITDLDGITHTFDTENFESAIIHVDCMDGMSLISDSSIDMVLCDLPYGITDHLWDVKIPVDNLWKQYRRIVKKNGRIVLFAVQPFTTELIASNPREFSHMLYWKKNTATHWLSNDKIPLRTIEEIIVFNCTLNSGSHGCIRRYMLGELEKVGIRPSDTKQYFKNGGAHHWFRDGSEFRIPTKENYEKLQKTGYFKKPYSALRAEYDAENKDLVYNKNSNFDDFLAFQSETNVTRIHPTQKPLALCELLIQTYSNVGDTILDNCLGSGTTAIAAYHAHRNFIGFEKDDNFFKSATKRLNAAKAQTSLFDDVQIGGEN